MSEEERKARNMRESVGVKDWIAQMVNCWTKECGRQNTKDTSKLTGSLVSIESICEIAHSDNSEVTS